MVLVLYTGVAKKKLEPCKNLGFEILGKKTWNLKNFETNLELYTIFTCKIKKILIEMKNLP